MKRDYRITALITEQERDALERLAEAEDRTLSQTTRLAVRAYLRGCAALDREHSAVLRAATAEGAIAQAAEEMAAA